jgi:hypothetical protein
MNEEGEEEERGSGAKNMVIGRNPSKKRNKRNIFV